jgi:hypothetical protein
MRQRLAPVLLAGLLAVVVAACGGGQTESVTTPGGASNVLAAAAGKARDAGSSKLALSVEVTVPGQQRPATLAGEGAFDYRNERGTLTFDLGNLVGGLGGALGGSSQVEVVLDRTVVYMNFPALAQLLGGKPWIKLDLAELGKQAGVDLGELQALGQSDPSSFLQYLRGAASLQTVGTETVRGTKTTHYKAQIDFAKAIASVPEAERAQLKSGLDQLEKQTGSRTLPVDAWVGEDGLVRKIEVTYPAVAGGAPTSVTIELYDYGTPVQVTVPPADQVTDFAAIAALAGSGSSTSGGETATAPSTTP